MLNLFKDLNYRQGLNTCVLASYGVASYPFTRIPILDYFSAYCRHFELEQEHPERSYDGHFHRQKNGYEVIKGLHEESLDRVFNKCRETFKLEDVRGKDMNIIEKRLRECPETLLMLFINKSNQNRPNLASMHSIVVGYDQQKQLYYYDTNTANLSTKVSAITDLGTLGDRFLIVRNSSDKS